MKKTIQIMLVIGMLFACPVVNAQNKALEKALKKEYKQKKKEFEKEGWKIFTGRSIDVALLKHYEKLNENENLREIIGIDYGYSDAQLGRKNARTDAVTTYAQQARSTVEGRIVSDMGTTGEVSSEFNHFYAAFEEAVKKEIEGELIESFSIIREAGIDKKTKKQTYDLQIFFLVDEDAAHTARLRALENAMRESELAQKYADKVSKFIDEGF